MNRNALGFVAVLAVLVVFAPWARGDAPPVGYTRVEFDPGDLRDLRKNVGQSYYFDVRGATTGSVWGTDVYTYDSNLATAAVHAGVLRDGQRGVVLVTVLKGEDKYQGSTRNGVTTREYGAWDGSYRIAAVKPGR